MYYLNKIIGATTNPLSLALLSVVAGLVFAFRGRKWLGLGLIGCSVAWLWLWATPIMTFLVGAPLEREFLVDGRVPMVETFPAADAIVLLGGGMGADINFSPYAEMSARADRVWQAARLFKAGKAPKIVSTGFSTQDSTMPLLKDFGLAEESVLFLEARNTEEESKVIEKLCYRKILLVTSAWHMKRARLMFEKYAHSVDVVCAPADFESLLKVKNPFTFETLLPDVGILALNTVTLHEWIGIIGYKMFR